MKKSLKITIIVIGVLVGVIILDTAQAIIFNNSPIIRITKTYSNFHKKNIGILVETDIYDGVTQITRFKWEAHTLPIEENSDNLKDTYNKVSDYFKNEKVDRSNLGAYSLDEDNNVVEVLLIDNSKEKQEEFLKQTGASSKFIRFEQGGLYYNSSSFEFYITKLQVHNDIRFNSYYTFDNSTIYLASNLEEFYIKEKDGDITLKTYLSTAYQTFDDGIKSITDNLELKKTLQDGTKIYKSKDKDITMIVCNTTKNNKNIFIGDYSMEYIEGDF